LGDVDALSRPAEVELVGDGEEVAEMSDLDSDGPILIGPPDHRYPLHLLDRSQAPAYAAISKMNFTERQRRIERRQRLAGEWRSPAQDRAENGLFNACFELAEAARDLERFPLASSTSAAAASLGCISSALESQANAMLRLREAALRELPADPRERDGHVEQLGRLLFAIDQNLRFAAEASDLARERAAAILEAVAA
jgi:hypothetical protein